MEIQIPNNWNPRGYQMKLWEELEFGRKRAVIVWPRRSGKDSLCLNWTAREAIQKPGVYWHMAPTLNQVRRIVWNNIDSQGRRVTEQVFPDEIVKKRHEQDMRIELINGSIWQCVGSDNYDSLVGANPYGVVFSEYSISDPKAWDFIRPILAENNGWALFAYTPRGSNHGKTLFDLAQRNDNWFCQLLTADDTNHISKELLEEERLSGMSEEMFEQEYYCSFKGIIDGSYYGTYIQEAKSDGRITGVPYDSSKPVYTSWDIGSGDATAIWFFQIYGFEYRFIDYFESRGKKFNYYAIQLDKKGYHYGGHIMPHDAGHILFATGKSIAMHLQEHGYKNIKVLQREQKIVDELGIQEVRNSLPMSLFDERKCARGIECLENYKRKYDDKLKRFSKTPLHDWTSHGADAFRYFAMGREKILQDEYEDYEEDEYLEPNADGWLA